MNLQWFDFPGEIAVIYRIIKCLSLLNHPFTEIGDLRQAVATRPMHKVIG